MRAKTGWRRWMRHVLAVLAVLVLMLASVAIYLFWPTSGTLAGQAVRNDIPGLKRSLLLGADINGHSMWGWRGDNQGTTPLTAAVSSADADTVGFLLSRGADPNQRNGFGSPPICKAAIRGELEICRVLVESGADPALPDWDGGPRKTAREYAVDLGHAEVGEYLRGQVGEK